MAGETPLDANLGFLLSRAATALRTQIEHDLSEFAVTANQYPVLLLIHAGIASRPSEMAALLGIDRGAVTRLVDRLADKGLVARLDDPGDLRAAKVVLTERAKTLVPVLTTIAAARNEAALAHFSDDEKRHLLVMLRRLTAQVEGG
jgi:DNA-binding MarR family transcriptional regulator